MKKFVLYLFFTFFGLSCFAADIAVITIAAGEKYQKLVEQGMENKRIYCKKHGYDFILCQNSLDPSRHIYWSKILLALEALENPSYKWVVWMDADTLIMNLDVPIEDLIDQNFNFVIANTHKGLNSGVFFIKNCEWSKNFLKTVYSRLDCIPLIWPEQIAIVKVIKESPEYGSMCKIVPNRLFNSFLIERCKSEIRAYEPGDFLLHFAGIRGNTLLEIFNKYSKLVLNDRNLITLDRYHKYYGFQFCPKGSVKNEEYLSFEQKEQFRSRLSQYPHIKSVLEIGLNAGHSAENFFQSCKNLEKLVSFDINKHRYTSIAVDYFKRKYGSKFEFIPGDSINTVPRYASTISDQKFDLIYVDGKHTYESVISDILNCRSLAHPDTILWVNDYLNCTKEAMLSLEKDKIIKIVQENKSSGPHGKRHWIEARYLINE